MEGDEQHLSPIAEHHPAVMPQPIIDTSSIASEAKNSSTCCNGSVFSVSLGLRVNG